MEDRILDFISHLRKNGVRVSISETVDLFSSLRMLGISDRRQLKEVARATIVKKVTDEGLFDDIFDIFFSGGRIEPLSTAGYDPVRLDMFGISPELMARFLAEMAGGASPMMMFLISGDASKLEQMLKGAAGAQGFPAGEFLQMSGSMTNNMMGKLDLERLKAEFAGLRQALLAAGTPAEAVEDFIRELERRVDGIRDAAREFLKWEAKKKGIDEIERFKHDGLWEKEFVSMSEDELRRMKEVLSRLARKLKNSLSLRRARARRGKLDVKRTIRNSLASGGVPFRIASKKRKKERPQVVILCDVSDSVRNIAKFMLQFVYSLHDLFSRIRSYVFVADMGEVTERMKVMDIEDVFKEIFQGKVVNMFSHSNYGTALRSFRKGHMDSVNRKTTFIVLGDGRTNYADPCEWALRDVRDRAKNVIWLNPEPKSYWGTGDSEMGRYQKHCDMVRECANLKQLTEFVTGLVL
jgi:uncharacterized protein with von Willebrand factor type A (vWA) domain